MPDKFLTAADLGDTAEGAAFKTVLVDSATGAPVVPNGSLGFRYTESGEGKWNLDLEGVDPALSLHGAGGIETVEVLLPRFDIGQADNEGGGIAPPRRPGRPAQHRGRRAAGHHGVRPDARPVRRGPRRAARASGRPATTTPSPTRPAWQEEITGVPAARPSASAASSRRTPRTPAAGR